MTLQNAYLFGNLKNKFIILFLIFLIGCITVNVNFPESAVQRAADDFVRDLYKDASATTTVPTPTEEPKEKPSKTTSKKTKTTEFNIYFMNQAFAQELNMSSAKAREIKTKLASRVSEIVKWKQTGAIGENQEGELTLKDSASLSKDSKKHVEQLIEDENKDRTELYEEIQTTNSITDRKQTKIRKFFGNAFRQNSPAGTWIQSDSGNWSKK